MEVKTEKRKISMRELRQHLSPEEIRRLDSNGNADDEGYNIVMESGNISGKPGDYFAEGNIIILNKTGIHARPASVFVQTASKFKSKVQIKAKGKACDAKSILMIMSMGLTRGTEITIRAEGPDAYDAVNSLIKLVADKFGEE